MIVFTFKYSVHTFAIVLEEMKKKCENMIEYGLKDAQCLVIV